MTVEAHVRSAAKNVEKPLKTGLGSPNLTLARTLLIQPP